MFEQVRAAVVTVRTVSREVAPTPSSERSDPFVQVGGLGSGALVRAPEGDRRTLVLTAAHVVQTADQVVVEFAGGDKARAKVVSSVPQADVALLELEGAPRGVEPLVLGDSDAMRIGDHVAVVGAPLGLEHTLTAGYVGGRRKSSQILGALAELELFQTDASINPGNSGGPMFNMRGEVVGVVSHILTRSGGFEGIGFAVTSNLARRLLFEQGSIWSGAEFYVLRDELARAFNVPQKAGLLLQRIARGSPAALLGLRPSVLHAEIDGQKLLVGGDIVLAVAGVRIEPDPAVLEDVRRRVLALGNEGSLAIEVLRGGEVVTVERAMSRLVR